MKKIVFVLPMLFLIALFLLAGCNNKTKEENVTAADQLQDVYEAYGLKKGDLSIREKFFDNPPRIIQLKPIKLQWVPFQMQLDMEPITIERGKEARFNLSVQGIKGTGKVVINSDIALKYRDQKAGSGLFNVEHTTELKYYVSDRDVKDELQLVEKAEKTRGAYAIGPNEAGDFVLVIALGKEGGVGNLGEVICEVTGVRIR
jgi:hypothetical protein